MPYSKSLFMTLFLTGTPALAADTYSQFPIADALAHPAAKEHIGPDIPLYFGKDAHAPAGEQVATVEAIGRTNGFARDDRSGCISAFINAYTKLQEQARHNGASAVVDVRSFFKAQTSDTETKYLCANGTFLTGVGLRGTAIKLTPKANKDQLDPKELNPAQDSYADRCAKKGGTWTGGQCVIKLD